MKPVEPIAEQPDVGLFSFRTRLPWTSERMRFNRYEWAGAFGDLGTLIPFVVGYISVVGMDPAGVLLGFGIAMLASGLYYGTPFPVQPMKAIGAVATANTAHAVITPLTVGAAGLVTGVIWLLLGMTGFARRLRNWISDGVGSGVIIGLALSLILIGAKMISGGWVLGIITLTVTVALLYKTRAPVMLLLLLFSAIVAMLQDPKLAHDLAAVRPEFHLTNSSVLALSGSELLTATLLLAIPQLPLTLGNAVVATTRENNHLFPDRAVSESKVMISTGVMNLGSAFVGGVPMCHGAGGMAGHVRFGARTGGAPIILGVILLTLACFFSTSIQTLFRMFPLPILGVILVLAGTQLATGPFRSAKREDTTTQAVIAVTALACFWNVGVGFLVGLLLDQGIRYWRKRKEAAQ